MFSSPLFSPKGSVQSFLGVGGNGNSTLLPETAGPEAIRALVVILAAVRSARTKELVSLAQVLIE